MRGPEQRRKTLDACARHITHASGLESRISQARFRRRRRRWASFFWASSSLDPGRHVPSAVLTLNQSKVQGGVFTVVTPADDENERRS